MALEKGVRVYADCQAMTLVREKGRVRALTVAAMDRRRNRPSRVRLRFEADAFVIAAGGFKRVLSGATTG